MVDETPDEADNEITRIVRRPGPKVLPVSVMTPAPPVAEPAAAASTPSVVPPRAPANDLAPPIMPPQGAPSLASPMTPAAPPPAGVTASAPPVMLDRPRPMMTPPIRPAVPPVAAPQPARLQPAAASAVAAPAPVATPAAADVARMVSAEPAPASAPVAPAVHAVEPPKAAVPSVATSPEPVVGWLVIVKGPGRGTSHTLVTGRNSLGSGKDEDIRINFGDGAIALHGHLYIVYDEEAREFVVEDGKQKIVVRLNGKLLTETMPIGHGDELRIGATTLRFVALCGPDFDWHEPQPEEKPVASETTGDTPGAVTGEAGEP